MITYGSVCSGVEAATVAWHPLGWKPAWFSQHDPEHDYSRGPDFASAVLAHHYPDVPNLGDMTKLQERPEYHDRAINLLVGGTPCQSFSVAGLRKGLDDPRGNLALQFGEILACRRPRWFLWENVPGVLSSGSGRDFAAFLGLVSGQSIQPPADGWGTCGIIPGYANAYGCAYRVLDAQYFGVPQRRRRVFVVGYLGDWRPTAAVLFERESLYGHPAPRRETGAGVAALTATGVGTCGADDNQAQAGHLIAMAHGQGGAEISEDGSGPTLTCNHESPIVCHIDGGDVARTLKARHDGSPDPDGKGYDVIAFQSKASASQSMNPAPVAPALDVGKNGGMAVAYGFKAGQGAKAGGIGYSAEQSPTLTAADSGLNTAPALLHRMAVRRLTPVECERLQAFRDNYTRIPYRGRTAELCPDGPRYKAMGNSMNVYVMRWLGQRIDAVDKIMKELKL